MPNGTGRVIVVVGSNRQARSSAKPCESSSPVGTPGTSPTYRLRSAKAVALASENRWRYCTSSTSEVGVPVRSS